MSVSLHVKLRELEKCGAIELKRDPERHQPGEGRYCYNGSPIEILTNQDSPPSRCVGEFVPRFYQQCDLAWCPKTNTLLAYAESVQEEFEFSTERLKIRVPGQVV